MADQAQIYSICKQMSRNSQNTGQKDELFLDSRKIALRYIIDGDVYEYIYNAHGPRATLPDDETSWLLQSLAVPQLTTQRLLFLKPILHVSNSPDSLPIEIFAHIIDTLI